MQQKNLTRTSLLLVTFCYTINASTFSRYFVKNGTKVVGNWQTHFDGDKGYKCCIACEKNTNCTAVNHNIDTKTCEMTYLSENEHFLWTASPGWNAYFTDLKEINPLSNAVATQSSTYMHYWLMTAELAIDGNTDGSTNGRSCSHTQHFGDMWWMVDFQTHFSVSSVVLWNRIETPVYQRLQGLKVTVGRSVSSLDNPNSICGSYTGPPLSVMDNPIRVNCTRVISGRFLKIEKQSPETGALTLCEVEVKL